VHCAGIAHPSQGKKLSLRSKWGCAENVQGRCAHASLLPSAAAGACAHALLLPSATAVAPSSSVQLLAQLSSKARVAAALPLMHHTHLRHGLLPKREPHTAYPNFEVIMELLFLQLRTFAHRLKPKYFTDCAPNCAPFKVSEEC